MLGCDINELGGETPLENSGVGEVPSVSNIRMIRSISNPTILEFLERSCDISSRDLSMLSHKESVWTNHLSGFALERWFCQQLTESCRYRRIGGWWMSGGKNAKGNQDDFEIDIVAETVDGNLEAYEVKRNDQKYNPARLAEKVAQMQRHNFKDKVIFMRGLSMGDMESRCWQ